MCVGLHGDDHGLYDVQRGDVALLKGRGSLTTGVGEGPVTKTSDRWMRDGRNQVLEGSKYLSRLESPNNCRDRRSHVIDRGRWNISSQFLSIRRPELGLFVPLLRRLRKLLHFRHLKLSLRQQIKHTL